MGKIVNMHEAKTHFSALAQQVEAGEEVIIAKAGRPFMKLVSYNPPKRTPGGAVGEFDPRDADAFIGIDPDIQKLFFDASS